MGTALSLPPKIAAIGIGSYVFSMGLLYDLIVERPIHGSTLVLMDVDEASADTMARIARRMAHESGVNLAIESTADRGAALDGAQFVATSVAVQNARRYAMDRAVLHEHGIHEALSECGGVGGLSYTLRSVPLLLEIAREMERRCPDAWLLNITNPLPRVLTAVTHTTSIRSAGFCNVAHGGGRGLYDNVAELVGRPADQIEVISGGLNHFSWLLAVRDTASGKDLMPYVQQAMQRGAWSDKPLTQECWRRYGVLPLPGDSHIGEFLPFNTQEFHTHLPDENERAARRDLLLAVADGKEPWQHLMEGRSWERPGIAASALATGASLHLDMVNLPNNSRVPNLPDDAIVETPAEIVDGELRAATLGPLPESIAELCAQVAAVHTLAARAAVTGNRALVEEVIRIDPAITNKPVALRAIKALLDVHADVLPQFRG